jgi:outer membrane protein assembly factor BamB
VGILRGAPVVGKNDRLYTLNDAGRVSAWTASTLAPQWNVDLPSVQANSFVSPTLDCRRTDTGQPSTGPGILYIGAASRLYAFIVDSPSLANAPWPKFQHDARNTGNPATPVTNCP